MKDSISVIFYQMIFIYCKNIDKRQGEVNGTEITINIACC